MENAISKLYDRSQRAIDNYAPQIKKFKFFKSLYNCQELKNLNCNVGYINPGFYKNNNFASSLPIVIDAIDDAKSKMISFVNEKFITAISLKPKDNYLDMSTIQRPLSDVKNVGLIHLYDVDAKFKISSNQAIHNLLLTGNNVTMVRWDANYNNFRLFQLPLEAVTPDGNNITHEIDYYYINRKYRYTELHSIFNEMEIRKLCSSYGITEMEIANEPLNELEVLIIIEKRYDQDEYSFFSTSEDKPWRSLYICPKTKELIKVGGFNYQPIIYSRLNLEPGRIHGESRFHYIEDTLRGIVNLSFSIDQAMKRNIKPITFIDSRAYDLVVNRPSNDMVALDMQVMNLGPQGIAFNTNQFESQNLNAWMAYLERAENIVSRVWKTNQVTQQSAEDLRGKLSATEVVVLTEASNQFQSMIWEGVIDSYHYPVLSSLIDGTYIKMAPDLFAAYPESPLWDKKLSIELQDPSIVFNNISQVRDIQSELTLYAGIKQLYDAADLSRYIEDDRFHYDILKKLTVTSDYVLSDGQIRLQKLAQQQEAEEEQAIMGQQGTADVQQSS